MNGRLVGGLLGAAVLGWTLSTVWAHVDAASPASTGHENVLMSEALANVPGSNVTAVVVSYAPGGKSPAHHHAGSVFAYILEGEVKSQNSATGPAKVYQMGESFFEPAGSVHLVSENASTTKPARLLAIFIAPANAKLTTPEK